MFVKIQTFERYIYRSKSKLALFRAIHVHRNARCAYGDWRKLSKDPFPFENRTMETLFVGTYRPANEIRCSASGHIGVSSSSSYVQALREFFCFFRNLDTHAVRNKIVPPSGLSRSRLRPDECPYVKLHVILLLFMALRVVDVVIFGTTACQVGGG